MKTTAAVFDIDEVLSIITPHIEDICINVLDYGPWGEEEKVVPLKEAKRLLMEHYLISTLEEIFGLSFHRGLQRSDVLQLPLSIENEYRLMPHRAEELLFKRLVIGPEMYNHEQFLRLKRRFLIIHN